MAFDLHITFAGLCFFVDRKSAGELHVLMPPTAAHAAGHADHEGRGTPGMEPHVAVLGYATRFEDPPTSPGQYRNHELMHGTLDLRDLSTDHPGLQVVLRDVVDLKPYVQSPADPSAAEGQVILRHGTACPISYCDHFRGGRWWIGEEDPQYMSTRVHWLITDVTEQVGGEDGLQLSILDSQTGAVRENLPVLRPVGDTIELYVFHSLESDLPSSCGAGGGSNPNPGDEAEHFHAYYDLFEKSDREIPIFEGADEREAKRVQRFQPAAFAFAAGKLGCVVAKLQE